MVGKDIAEGLGFASRAGQIRHCRQRLATTATFLCCPGARPQTCGKYFSCGIVYQWHGTLCVVSRPIFANVFEMYQKNQFLLYSRIAPKRVTSDVAHLHGLASGQHTSEEPLQLRRVVGNTVSDSTIPGVEPRPSAPTAMYLTS